MTYAAYEEHSLSAEIAVWLDPALADNERTGEVVVVGTIILRSTYAFDTYLIRKMYVSDTYCFISCTNAKAQVS